MEKRCGPSRRRLLVEHRRDQQGRPGDRRGDECDRDPRRAGFSALLCEWKRGADLREGGSWWSTDGRSRDAPGPGAATNAIAIRVARDSVHFYVNGKEVRTFAKAALGGAPTEGLAGIRVNHNLDIEVREFG